MLTNLKNAWIRHNLKKNHFRRILLIKHYLFEFAELLIKL